jgi:hypothetical protein
MANRKRDIIGAHKFPPDFTLKVYLRLDENATASCYWSQGMLDCFDYTEA